MRMGIRLRDRGNAVAIGLGLLAVVVAGTGTAVAVTATVVNIADPTKPTQVAHVDAAGRLQVAGSTSSIAVSGAFNNLGRTQLTSPTRANLVITGLALDETRLNGTLNGSDLTVFVSQMTVDGAGQCVSGAERTLFTTNLSSRDHVELAGSSRLLVKPVASQQYCIVIDSAPTNGGADDTPFFARYSLTADVAAGTYTGVGTAADPARVTTDVRKTHGPS